MTDGVDATLVVIDTGILALLADTCEGAHTVAVYSALGLAEDVGVTLETRGTGADASVTTRSGQSVLTTRVGVTGVTDHRVRHRGSVTLDQSIADVSRQTGAQRRVVPDLTLGVLTTQTRTGVIAVIVAACLVTGAVRVDDTLGFAFSVGVTKQAGGTRALTLVSHLPRDGPGAAGVGAAWVSNNGLS